MLDSRAGSSVAGTLLVGVATVLALALPGGIGGRDSVVRLTRGSLQRMGCPDTSTSGHDIPESCIDVPAPTPSGTARPQALPPVTLAAPTALAVVPVPVWRAFVPSWPAPFSGPAVPRGHAAAGRAPPAL